MPLPQSWNRMSVVINDGYNWRKESIGLLAKALRLCSQDPLRVGMHLIGED